MLMSKDNQKIVNINVACKYVIYNQGTESALLDNKKKRCSSSVSNIVPMPMELCLKGVGSGMWGHQPRFNFPRNMNKWLVPGAIPG